MQEENCLKIKKASNLLKISKLDALEWAQQGSNLRPPDYESDALTD